MVFKRLLILISIILVVALLGACVRSASTPPIPALAPAENQSDQEQAGETEAQEPGGETAAGASEGQPTNEVLQQLALFVTQTAVAAQLVGGQQPAEAGQAATPYPPVESGQTGVETPPVESSQSGTPATGTTGEQPQTGQPAEATQPTGSQPSGEPPTSSQEPVATQPTAGGQEPAAPQPTEAAQPAPSTTTMVITPTPGIPKNYTLQSGEFPYCIARRFNVNPFELLSINGLTTSSIVHGGATLKIPQTGNRFPGERALQAHPTVYVVQGGENIYEIACSFGDVSPDMIALANGMQQPFTLTAGQNLNIP